MVLQTQIRTDVADDGAQLGGFRLGIPGRKRVQILEACGLDGIQQVFARDRGRRGPTGGASLAGLALAAGGPDQRGGSPGADNVA